MFGSYCNMCHIVIVNAVQLWRSIYIQFYRCHVSNFACIITLVLHLKLYFYHYFSFPIPLVEHGEKKGPIQNHHLQVASFSNFYNYMYGGFIISLITGASCGKAKLFNYLVVVVLSKEVMLACLCRCWLEKQTVIDYKETLHRWMNKRG